MWVLSSCSPPFSTSSQILLEYHPLEWQQPFRPSWSLKRWKTTGTVYLPNMAVISRPNGFQQYPTDQLHAAVWKHHVLFNAYSGKGWKHNPSTAPFQKFWENIWWFSCTCFFHNPSSSTTVTADTFSVTYVGFKQFKTSDGSPTSHQKTDCNRRHHGGSFSAFHHTVWVRLILEPKLEGLSTPKVFHHDGLALQPIWMSFARSSKDDTHHY